MGILSASQKFNQQPDPRRPRPLGAPAMLDAQPMQPLPTAPQGQLAQAPTLAPAGFMERFENTLNSQGFQQGIAMLGAAQPGGGGWGQASQDMMRINQAEQQRVRQEREDERVRKADQRTDTQFGWAQDEQRRQQQERIELDRWVASLPEADQQAARANPAMAYQAFMEARALANQPITPAQQVGFDLQRRGLEIDAFQAANSTNRSQYLRGPDRDLMEQIRTSSGSANELLGMAQMFREANDRTATGGGSQYIPFSSDRAAMRQVSSMMRGMMRPIGSGATSDYEQRLYAEGVPDTALLGPQNAARIRNIETLARIRNARRYFYEDYAEANGSLNGAERAFQESAGFRQLQAQNPVEQRGGAQGATRQQSGPRSYGNQLPNPADFPEGHELENDNGAVLVKRNGRWVPQHQPLRNIGAGTR